MIPFNKPPYLGTEMENIKIAIEAQKICGDGEFTKKCNAWLENKTSAVSALLTTSCSHALEMAAMLLDIKPGDEVIVPSFTFVTTASSFALRGAKLVFCDIRPDTMNIDENLIEDAITDKTRAIVPVHYAGVAAEMDKIMDIARRHNVSVVEDAAQAVMSEYKGKACGAIADIGCYSFHETKNYSMGEGGAILLNDNALSEKAEIIREKGTDRSQFLRGQVDKYTWVDLGSSYLPSDMNAAYLYAQLQKADEINENRIASYNLYKQGLSDLEKRGVISLPFVPEHCKHNAHMFYIKTEDLAVRTDLISYLKKNDILSVFHYVPLHSAPAGEKYGRFHGNDVYTTRESERLVRLPMFYGLEAKDIEYIVDKIYKFFK